jgi:hypothetical protein
MIIEDLRLHELKNKVVLAHPKISSRRKARLAYCLKDLINFQ